MSREPFTWGHEREINTARVSLFKDVVGGFKPRGYPPGYTFTRALSGTVVSDAGGAYAITGLAPFGDPGADVLPALHDFSTFIIGKWNGSFAFEFRADGTWTMQKPGGSLDPVGRNWTADGDTLTITESAHLTTYKNLAVSGQQLILWNNGPLILTRIQSATALNLAPTGGFPPTSIPRKSAGDGIGSPVAAPRRGPNALGKALNSSPPTNSPTPSTP